MSTEPIESEKPEKIEPTPEEVALTDEAFIDERMRFVQSYPFYGILLLELKGIATGEDIPIAAVNYKNLFLHAIDQDRVPIRKDKKGQDIPGGHAFWKMTSQGRKTVLAHEILHLVFEHLSIPKGFDRQVANIAMDAVINRILEKDGSFSLAALPPGIVTPIRNHSGLAGFTVGTGPKMQTYMIEKYVDLDWTPIYWQIMEQLEKQHGSGNRDALAKAIKELGGLNPMDGDVDAQEEGSETADQEQQIARFRQKVIAAAEAAKTQGQCPAEVDRLVGQLQDGKVHWTSYLRRLLKTEITRDDFSNKSNSRRAHLGGRGRPSIFPKVESEALGDVFLALDTSGSMSQKDLIDGLSEFAALRQCTPFRLHFVSCDAKAYDVKTYERFEDPDWLAMPIHGGGGTDFRPVFTMVEEMRETSPIRPALMVYFTDTMGSFPEEEPDYPVIWVCNWPNGKVPWGQLVSTVDN